jgi:site-specific recombinase XerD
MGEGTKERLAKWISKNKMGANDLIVPLGTTALRRRLKIIEAQSGIDKPVTPHKFRHSFATHMYQRTGDIAAVSTLLRHVDLKTTMVYTHSTTDDLQKLYATGHPLA